MPRAVGLGDQGLESRPGSPKHRVDGQVIGGVIPVVGRRFEDRVEVDRRDAQVLQVIQLVDQALQVAAVEVLAVSASAVVPSARGSQMTVFQSRAVSERTIVPPSSL